MRRKRVSLRSCVCLFCSRLSDTSRFPSRVIEMDFEIRTFIMHYISCLWQNSRIIYVVRHEKVFNWKGRVSSVLLTPCVSRVFLSIVPRCVTPSSLPYLTWLLLLSHVEERYYDCISDRSPIIFSYCSSVIMMDIIVIFLRIFIVFIRNDQSRLHPFP